MALVAAAVAGNHATTRLLLSSSASISTAQEDGRTALHCWAERGDTELFEELLRAQADVNICDKKGVTPLMCAVRSSSATAVQWLCEHGATLEAVAGDGRTALVDAAEVTNEPCGLQIARLLIKQRASIEAATSLKNAPSPLVTAAAAGRQSVAAPLLEARALVNASDGRGCRPLPCAAIIG